MTLRAKNLDCQRGGKYIFRKLSFDVSNGQLLLIKGYNGAGKSTLLKILAGLISPTDGHVQWLAQNIRDLGMVYNINMSYLGHKEGLKKCLTPYENAQSMGFRGKIPPYRDLERVFAQYNLTSTLHVRCAKLSQGQQRKVALALFILMQKKLWLLDEPFASLDKASENSTQEFFQRHLCQGGMIVMTSHSNLPSRIIDQVIDLSRYNKC